MINWIITIFALYGTYLNANQKRAGFWFWLVSNIYLCIYNAYIEQYPLSLMFGVYAVLAIVGLVKWKSKKGS